MIYNNVSIEAYSSGMTPIVDPLQLLKQISGLTWNTQYPGGLYGECSFIVPRKLADFWELQGATRIVARNDLRQVYEGYITNIQHTVDDFSQYSLVRCVGGWGHILMNWRIRKRWADDRIDPSVWVQQTSGIEVEEWNIDRQSRIHISPRAGQFASGEYVALRYTMPTGETIKRLTYDYDYSEKAGQSWEMSVYRSTTGTSWTAMGTAETYAAGSTTVITTTGTAAIDVALAEPSQYAELRYYARATNNPVNDDHNHATWNNLKVYSETGDIGSGNIVYNIIGLVSDINSSARFVSSNAFNMVPFLADNYESAADLLSRIGSYGDSTYRRWAAYLVGSERAFIPDGKPLLAFGAYPATTDYDYLISLADDNLISPFSISQDFDNIANWIVVSYVDLDGYIRYRSPDDNASLKDDTSISQYGRRAEVVSIPGTSTETIADSVGQRYLATYKDPQYHMISPIVVREYIRGKSGMIYPASEIRSSYRIRIEDYTEDVTGTGQQLTFVITGTRYEDDTHTCSITTGVPEAPIIPGTSIQRSAPPVPGDGGSGGSGTQPVERDPGWNWWERYGRVEGLSTSGPWQGEAARQAWLGMSEAQRRKWKRTKWKAWKKKKG